jgi:hypothetical protein
MANIVQMIAPDTILSGKRIWKCQLKLHVEEGIEGDLPRYSLRLQSGRIVCLQRHFVWRNIPIDAFVLERLHFKPLLQALGNRKEVFTNQ